MGRHGDVGLGCRPARVRDRRVGRHPQGDPDGPRRHVRPASRADLRFSGPHRQQRHRPGPHDGIHRRQPGRALHPLRHPRARHGSGTRRHGSSRRHPADQRHVLRVRRLHAPADPPRRTLERQVLFRLHPRLGRCRRGRPDPPARRASRHPACDAEPARDTSRRRQRDDSCLGRRRPPRRTVRVGAESSEHPGHHRRISRGAWCRHRDRLRRRTESGARRHRQRGRGVRRRRRRVERPRDRCPLR